jgi:hypothetical protein
MLLSRLVVTDWIEPTVFKVKTLHADWNTAGTSVLELDFGS